jgi:SnoaL-like domain
MVWLSHEEAAATAMISKLIISWAAELDRNDGVNLAPLIATDCRYMVRGIPRNGPKGVVDFYRGRLDELKQTPAGPPTQRHVVSNLLIDFNAPGKASVSFLLTYYASPQKPPVTDFQGPVAVADCHMDCSLEADDHWRISSFDSVQSFVRKIS